VKVQLVKGQASNILTVFIQDSSSTVGAGLGSLDQNSSIVGGYVRAGATGVALAVDEDVTTEGTYQAPSAAGKVRIGTPANMTSGTYELHFHNDLFAAGADILTITLGGAANMAPIVIEVQLTTVDLNTAILDGNGRVDVGSWLGTAVTLSSSAPDVNIQSTDNIDLSVTQKASVKTEAGTALSDINLDHLMKTATASSTDLTTEVADNTVLAYLMTNDGNTSDYDDSLMSLEASAKDRVLFRGTSTASSTTTKVFVQAGDPPTGGVDNDYNDTIIAVWDGTDKATARVNIRVVDDYDDSDPSFTVSPALGFTPTSTDIVEVYRADTGALTLLSTIAAGFAGTSPNRLIDHLRSIMSKGAVTPATVGTYNPATDSLEYQAEQQALGLGAGFATGTDSLKEIRDAIDTLVAPSVVGSSALSGSGFLSDCVSLIRKAVDEPSTTPKYTDGDIIELLQVAIDQVITDIHVNTDHPIMVRHTITLVDGVQDYILPPQVGELLRVAKIQTATGLAEYEVWPGSYHDPGNHGWKIEGNILRILRDWNSTDALELLYIPNSEPLLHKGTSEAETSTTIKLMAIPTDGTLGTRPNEYVGMVLRILSSTENIKEERVITSYDVTTRVATVNKAWDTTPTGTVVYEIVPTFGRMFKHVCSLRAAIDLLSQEGNAQRMGTLERNYVIKMSALRRQASKKEGRFPHHFDGDTWDNVNRGGGFYGL